MNKQITVFSGIVIHNDKVLLQLRSESELPDAHLKWELPGGKVSFDETPQQAVIREVFEETGREVQVKELLPFVQTNYWNYPWGRQQTICLIFVCELVKDGEPKEKDHHVEEIKWFSFDEIPFEDCLPGMREIMELIKRR